MDHQRKLLSIFDGYILCYKDCASRLIHVILILTTFLVGWIDTFEFKDHPRASLVAQWLRICLPMQRTRVRSLVWENPTCRGATRPVSHNY